MKNKTITIWEECNFYKSQVSLTTQPVNNPAQINSGK